jgi:hypothetical protein
VVESLGLPQDVRFVGPSDAQFFRKGSKAAGLDMNRDDVWAVAEKKGLSPLGLVSVDDTWAAFRLRRARGGRTGRDG